MNSDIWIDINNKTNDIQEKIDILKNEPSKVNELEKLENELKKLQDELQQIEKNEINKEELTENQLIGGGNNLTIEKINEDVNELLVEYYNRFMMTRNIFINVLQITYITFYELCYYLNYEHTTPENIIMSCGKIRRIFFGEEEAEIKPNVKKTKKFGFYQIVKILSKFIKSTKISENKLVGMFAFGDRKDLFNEIYEKLLAISYITEDFIDLSNYVDDTTRKILTGKSLSFMVEFELFKELNKEIFTATGSYMSINIDFLHISNKSFEIIKIMKTRLNLQQKKDAINDETQTKKREKVISKFKKEQLKKSINIKKINDSFNQGGKTIEQLYESKKFDEIEKNELYKITELIKNISIFLEKELFYNERLDLTLQLFKIQENIKKATSTELNFLNRQEAILKRKIKKTQEIKDKILNGYEFAASFDEIEANRNLSKTDKLNAKMRALKKFRKNIQTLFKSGTIFNKNLIYVERQRADSDIENDMADEYYDQLLNEIIDMYNEYLSSFIPENLISPDDIHYEATTKFTQLVNLSKDEINKRLVLLKAELKSRKENFNKKLKELEQSHSDILKTTNEQQTSLSVQTGGHKIYKLSS